MDTDVIIIGAGAAGVAAALWLADRSVSVIVLDGRDRIGGRVMWQPVGSVDVPAELGAEFIHGDAPETSALLLEAGVAKIETGGASWVCSADGELRLVDEADFTANAIFERVRSLPKDESVDAFLRRFDSDPELHHQAKRARAFVEGFEAADPAIASVRSIADEIQSGVDSTSSRPIGGYAPLFEHLRNRCAQAGVDIRLGTAVTNVAWQHGSVTIDARSEDGGSLTLRARRAIITVPVGVLHQRAGATPFTFAPELPPEKHEALRALEMGHAVRVTLAFRTPFWEEIDDGRYRDAAFFRCEAGSFNAFWAQLPERSRTIVAWAGGPRATAMNGMTTQEHIDRAFHEFGTMLGHTDVAQREYEGGVMHDWTADPFACGAYSYVVAGGDSARAALGRPVDETLFFAGEATCIDGQGGTVSGAFESGMRAAHEAADSLARRDVPSQKSA